MIPNLLKPYNCRETQGGGFFSIGQQRLEILPNVLARRQMGKLISYVHLNARSSDSARISTTTSPLARRPITFGFSTVIRAFRQTTYED